MAQADDTTDRVLMIRPARFGANPETAATNAYQRESLREAGATQRDAVRELEAFTAALRAAGVDVVVLDDTPEPHTPDALFPNNWVSFHADGTVVLYPLLAPSRRAEIRRDLLERLRDEHGLAWRRIVDLTDLTRDGAFLEGTGSMVLDRAQRVAYACLSPRTTERGLDAFAERMGYAIERFRAEDGGLAIYHTNVLMSIGPAFAVIALECIPDAAERERVRARLKATGHDVLALTRAQMRSFAGNLLALRSRAGEPLIALSDAAWASLDDPQRAALERHGKIVRAPLPTIETYGGGSARCMLAELFAPSA
jgi:hypothetical protein